MYSCVESQTETFQERRSTLLHQNPIPEHMTWFSLCSFELCRVTGYVCRKLRPFLNFFEQNIVIPSNLTGRCVSSFWMSLFLFPSDMMHRVTRCPTFCFLIPILFCFTASWGGVYCAVGGRFLSRDFCSYMFENIDWYCIWCQVAYIGGELLWRWG